METQLVRRPDGPQAWEDHEALIVDLYITRGLKLSEVMNIMEKEHFFKATEKQYKSHFTEWGIRKNVKSKEWDAILRKKRRREQEGKESAFRLGGTRVDSMRIAREEKRRKPGDQSRLAEAVTPPDLICSTPSPVAYIPVARSPTFSPIQLSEPSSISILPSLERTLDALRPIALIFDRWPNSALAYQIAIESFLRIFIWMVHPLLDEERGILTYAIQTTISMSNGCFLCWAKLVLEMLEASRAKNKPTKRDYGNRFYKWIVKLVINHLAKGPHGKLCGLGSSFVVTMDSFEQLLRIIETHAISGQTLRISWMLCTCNSLIHKAVDYDQYEALLVRWVVAIAGFVSERCAVGEDLDRTIYLQIAADSDHRPAGLLSFPFLIVAFESIRCAVVEEFKGIVYIQIDADSDLRPAGLLSFRFLLDYCDAYYLYLLLMEPGMSMAVGLTKKLSKLKRMNAYDGISSPAPPSPGSDRSQISFLSDSVVDWKELRRGLSPYNSTQGNEEAWIDKLEALE